MFPDPSCAPWLRSPLEFDRLDLDDGKLLAVALLALVPLALLLLEHHDLVAALVLENLGGDDGARQGGPAHLEVGALPGGQHVLYLDRCAGLGVREAVHNEDVPLLYDELLPLGLDGRFHGIKPLTKPFWRGRGKAIFPASSRCGGPYRSRCRTRPGNG